MEAFEKGDLLPDETGGLDLRWGDMATVIDVLLFAIARREGQLGALLAEGSRAAAGKLGKGLDYTAQSKGLEAPMHDPRGGGYGLALTYAVGARGACHVADPMLFIEMGARYYPEIGFEYILEPQSEDNKAEAATVSVALGAIENSACFCQFADAEVTIPDWLTLFRTVPGYDWDGEEMLKAGRRIFYLKRMINGRYGLDPQDDDVTPRMADPGSGGEAEGARFDLEKMRARFYELMAIEPTTGMPTKEALKNCGMAGEN
jgi:aldehyde:ferredoxin oxidoreductase